MDVYYTSDIEIVGFNSEYSRLIHPPSTPAIQYYFNTAIGGLWDEVHFCTDPIGELPERPGNILRHQAGVIYYSQNREQIGVEYSEAIRYDGNAPDGTPYFVIGNSADNSIDRVFVGTKME